MPPPVPPKRPLHAGAPQRSPLPKAAGFLMRAEDRGAEDDADPTDGGQMPDAADEATAPELREAMQALMDQFGTEAVQAAVDECAESYKDRATVDDEAAAAAADDAGDHEYSG